MESAAFIPAGTALGQCPLYAHVSTNPQQLIYLKRLCNERKTTAYSETLRCTNPCQVGESQQHKRDVPVPASKTADLIVIQSQIFGIFTHPLRYASVRQWPLPSLAKWFLPRQRRSSTLSRWGTSRLRRM